MKIWTEVRRRMPIDEFSKRAACQEYGIKWQRRAKMLPHSENPDYRRRSKREKPFLGTELA